MTPNSSDRGPREPAGDRGPADEHRHAPGGAAPHDVLRGAALEDHRVADDVDEDRRGGQPGRRRVDHDARATRATRRRARGEHQRRARADLAGDDRPPLGAVHDLVDVAVEVQLRTFAEPAAAAPPTSVASTSHEAGNAAGRQDHRRHGGDEQQLDDARLGQRDVRPDRPAQPATRAASARRSTVASGAPGVARSRRSGVVDCRGLLRRTRCEFRSCSGGGWCRAAMLRPAPAPGRDPGAESPGGPVRSVAPPRCVVTPGAACRVRYRVDAHGPTTAATA